MNEYDTTKAIWDYLYLVRYPVQMARSVEDIRMFGVPVTGDKKKDKHVMDEQGWRWMNINDMVELFREGVPVYLKTEDTKPVYEAISAHICAWKKQLEFGFNNGNAPVADLILMDEFANSVYEHAVWHYPRDQKEGTFMTQLRQTSIFTLKSPARNDIRAAPVDPKTLPKRSGLGEFFKERFASMQMQSEE